MTPNNFREKANFIWQVDDVIKQYEQFQDSLDEERLTPILWQAD